jgi:hypothetical protein
MGRQKVNGQKMRGWRWAPTRHATNVSLFAMFIRNF